MVVAAGMLTFVAGGLYAGETQLEVFPRGKTIYEAHCIPCHGRGGRGDGPSAYAMVPRPPDFTDPAVKDVLTKTRIIDAVTKGKRGTQMEGSKNKLSAQDIQEVMEYIQSLK